MNATKWGIIGPGNIAHTFVNDLDYIRSPQQVTAVLGHNTQNTYEFARKFGIPEYYTHPNDFLKDKNIDVAYIASPHPQHFEHALACLENDIPVLCEKPMTINAAQCEELISTAQRKKIFLMEGMWVRFLPSIQQALDMIQADMIGRVTSIRASVSFKAPHESDSRFFSPEAGGGSLLDLGIYPVFLALLVLGKPGSVKAIAKLSKEGVDEACSVLLHYKNGNHAILESSLSSSQQIPAEITGEKGTIRILNPWFEKASGIELARENEGQVIYPCHWEGHGLYFETEEVIKCIANGQVESELLSHSFSLDMISVLDEIRNQISVTYDMHE